MEDNNDKTALFHANHIGSSKEEFIKRLKSVCFGTVVNALTVTPFDVLKVRLQSQVNLSGNIPKLALNYPVARTKNIIRFNHEFIRTAEHLDGLLVRISIRFLLFLGWIC